MLNIEPKGWNQITVSQFKEIHSIKRDDFKSLEEYQIQLFSIISDTPPEYFEELEYEEFINMQEKFLFVSKLPSNPPRQKIMTPAGELYLYDNFKTHTIGEFIDLEHFVTSNIEENTSVILAILYRQKIASTNPLLYLDKFESYGDWIYLRESLFDDVKLTDVYGIIPKFLSFREQFYADYSGLFDDTVVSDEEFIDPNESIIARAERVKEEKKDQLSKKWGWDLLLYRLAKMDNKSLQEVTNMPLVQAFNMLSMKKEMQISD